MNEPKGNNHQDDPDRDIEQPPAPVERQHAAVNDTAGGNQSNNKETNWPQRIEAICAVLLVVITGFYTFYARKQLKAMQGQITEMKNTRVQSKLDSANAITAQQAIAQSALSASQTNFDKAAQGAENTFRDEQRAWIGISSISGDPKINEIWKILVVFHNSGKTPARNLAGHVIFNPTKDGDDPNFSYIKDAGFKGGVLPPNGDSNITLETTKNPTNGETSVITQPLLDAITSGQWHGYVHGRITYDDVFGCQHWLTFCYFTHPGVTGYSACSVHNDTGDGKECKK